MLEPTCSPTLNGGQTCTPPLPYLKSCCPPNQLFVLRPGGRSRRVECLPPPPPPPNNYLATDHNCHQSSHPHPQAEARRQEQARQERERQRHQDEREKEKALEMIKQQVGAGWGRWAGDRGLGFRLEFVGLGLVLELRVWG